MGNSDGFRQAEASAAGQYVFDAGWQINLVQHGYVRRFDLGAPAHHSIDSFMLVDQGTWQLLSDLDRREPVHFNGDRQNTLE